MEHLLTTTTAGPTGTAGSTAGGGGYRRARQGAVVALAAFALAGGLLACNSDVGDTGRAEPTTSAPVRTSPRHDGVRTAPAPAPVPAVAPPAQSAPGPAPAPASQGHSAGAPPVASGGASPTAGLPTNPQGYATAAFDAWLQSDDQRLTKLTTEPVAEFLGARTPDEPGEWSGPTCEGAAGSTYCAWAQPETQLVIRVTNEDASNGRRHAVTEAFFTAPAGGVALWPYTTAEQAAETQTAVDEGHQPWRVRAESVAEAYANSVLGWRGAGIEPVQGQPSTYRVTDPASGAQAVITLSQPARHGNGGIWAIVRVGSAPAA
jgi:hypothetical protein